MEVVHQGDSVTHAVIGGKAAITMKTDDSAHLMHMLSKALYKDQILAVCREVICNAWDAHIEAGITDRRIKVDITDDILTIQDFGPGIPYEKMGDVYGTYGGSTKKDSKNQTGGFGLGCKSPFAYCEHFDVISTHKGERTMYKITKSSAEIAGKPGIIPISSFPSQESGLIVKIRLNPRDISEFETKIQRVLRNGEIHCDLDGDYFDDLLEFSKATQPWLFTRTDVYPGERGKIFVRYGNVIYPVDDHEEYSSLYQDALKKIDYFTLAGHSRMNIVLLAEPDSLSIAPSRETLSMQEHTIKTLKAMLENFVYNATKTIQPALWNHAQANVKNVIAVDNGSRLLLSRKAQPIVKSTGSNYLRRNSVETVYDFKDMAFTFMQNSYPEERSFWERDMRDRLKALVGIKKIDGPLTHTFMRHVRRFGWYNRPGLKHVNGKIPDWVTRHMVVPAKLALREQGMSETMLYALDVKDFNWQYQSSYRNDMQLFSTQQLMTRSQRDLIPYLRKIVVIGYGKKDIKDRVRAALDRKGWAAYGDSEQSEQGVFVYIVNRKKENVEKALAAFKGWNILDLTKRQPHEPESVTKPPAERKKPRLKGYVALEGMFCRKEYTQPDGTKLEKRTGEVDLRRFLNAGVVEKHRILKPEFIINQSMASSRGYSYSRTSRIDGLTDDKTVLFMKTFGHLGAITNSAPQVERAFKHDGVKSLQLWIVDRMDERLKDPSFVEAYRNSYDCANTHIYKKGRRYTWDDPVQKELIQLVCDTPALASQLGVAAQLTKEDKVLLMLFNDLAQNVYLRSERIKTLLKLIYPSPGALELEHNIQKSRLTGLVNINAASRMITSGNEPDDVVQATIDFIKHAISA